MPETRRSAAAVSESTPRLSDQDISDAYLYLLGRLLVLRQEHLDFAKEDFAWNDIVHRDPGGAGWANPNLEIAYSEAWVAIDEGSAILIEVPPISGRYYTIQLVNLWGETVANVNERNFPDHPAGLFAACVRGAPVPLPAGAERIDLPGRKARLLVRLELGSDPAAAVALQHRIAIRALGRTSASPPVSVPMFGDNALPGVEAFDTALAVLASEPDLSRAAPVMQARVRAIATGIEQSTAQRQRVDHVIREQAWGALKQDVAAMEAFANGWVRPRVTADGVADWRRRTVSNLTRLWANSESEVVSFGMDAAARFDGSDAYAMWFAPDDLPGSHVRYFWSVVAVDAINFRVVPNRLDRHVLNSQSALQHGTDGSLTLYFAPARPPVAPEANWLPTPPGEPYVLTWRSYGADPATVSGAWFPPPLKRL